MSSFFIIKNALWQGQIMFWKIAPLALVFKYLELSLEKKWKSSENYQHVKNQFNFGHWKQKPWHGHEVLSDSFDQPKLQLYTYWKCPLLNIYTFITDGQLYKKITNSLKF